MKAKFTKRHFEEVANILAHARPDPKRTASAADYASKNHEWRLVVARFAAQFVLDSHEFKVGLFVKMCCKRTPDHDLLSESAAMEAMVEAINLMSDAA